MKTTSLERFEMLSTEQLAAVEGGRVNWANAGQGALLGAGIGAGLCGAAGVVTGGVSAVMSGGCAWAGAKLGASVVIIADNIVK